MRGPRSTSGVCSTTALLLLSKKAKGSRRWRCLMHHAIRTAQGITYGLLGLHCLLAVERVKTWKCVFGTHGNNGEPGVRLRSSILTRVLGRGFVFLAWAPNWNVEFPAPLYVALGYWVLYDATIWFHRVLSSSFVGRDARRKLRAILPMQFGANQSLFVVSCPVSISRWVAETSRMCMAS